MPPDYSDTQTGKSFIDYRPTRCRCNAVVLPHHLFCLNCGKKQNILFSGLEKLVTGDLLSAVEKFKAETRDRPYDYVKLHKLAGTYVLLGKYEEAAGVYRQILQRKPDYSESRLNLGVVLACMGDEQEAVLELGRFIRQDPHSSKAERALRAICSIKNIPYEDAIKRPEKVLPPLDGIGAVRRRGGEFQPRPAAAKRAWGTIDLILLVMILTTALAYFAMPKQFGLVLDSFIASIEEPLSFTVVSESKAEIETQDPNSDEEDPENRPDYNTPINLNPKSQSYFPLKAGNHWTYASFDTRDQLGMGKRDRQGTRENKVIGYADAEKDIWEVSIDGEIEWYIERNNGIFTTDSLSSPWGGMLCQVPYPAEVGKTVDSHGMIVTVEAEEDVETAAGVISCVKVHYMLVNEPSIQWWAWYGKGIGMVKYVGGGRDGTYHVQELTKVELR